MIVRDTEQLKALGNYREKPGVWSSARYLLKADGVGFTLTQTTVSAGSSQTMRYRNHIEANLVIEGSGTVTDLETNETYPLAPGSMYALEKHERHRIDATTDMRLVCVFTPGSGRSGNARRGRFLPFALIGVDRSDVLVQPGVKIEPVVRGETTLRRRAAGRDGRSSLIHAPHRRRAQPGSRRADSSRAAGRARFAASRVARSSAVGTVRRERRSPRSPPSSKAQAEPCDPLAEVACRREIIRVGHACASAGGDAEL